MPDYTSANSGSGSTGAETLEKTDHPAIDLAHLSRYTFGDAELQREVLGLFAGQLTASLDELRSADTAESWRRAAHTLKGSSHAVGATALAAAMQNAESLLDADDVRARHAALVRIEAEVRTVACFLSSSSLV